MPKMTKRWRNAAIVMAIGGFVSFAIKLVTVQYIYVLGDTSCLEVLPDAAGCLVEVTYNPGPTLVLAAVGAATWFGIVYGLYLVFYGIRKAAGR